MRTGIHSTEMLKGSARLTTQMRLLKLLKD